MAKEKEMKIEKIKLSLIDVDPQNPRRSFDAALLKQLADSIKEHGIIHPLVVELLPTGRYQLVDGERRYRASKLLNLKEVPVLIEEPMTSMERLVQQFHLQEQHQGWSSLEKAMAVIRFSDETGLSVKEMGKALGLNERTTSTYAALARLGNIKAFSKEEIPVHYAEKISQTITVARSALRKAGESLTKETQSDLELEIIGRISRGDIAQREDLGKLQDAIKADPSVIDKVIKKKTTSLSTLFNNTNAKQVRFHRQLMYGLTFWRSNLQKSIALGYHVGVFNDDEKKKIKDVAESLQTILKSA